MKMIKSLILGSTAGLIAMSGAQAADLPVKAKAVEYVKVCSLYGAGFWYIPGTDTCIRIGGAIRIDTALNGDIYDAPFWQGGASGFAGLWQGLVHHPRPLQPDRGYPHRHRIRRSAYLCQRADGLDATAVPASRAARRSKSTTRSSSSPASPSVRRFRSSIRSGRSAKPTISSGFNAGSNNATGINQLAYTATFGNGVSGTISLEDGQPYRTAGLVNTSTNFIAPFQANTLAAGTYGVGSFAGNAVVGDHVPDVVGNLRLDQAWGTLHFAAAAHEVHGTYFTAADSATGHPGFDLWLRGQRRVRVEEPADRRRRQLQG